MPTPEPKKTQNKYFNGRPAKLGDPCVTRGLEGVMHQGKVMRPNPASTDLRGIFDVPNLGRHSSMTEECVHLADKDQLPATLPKPEAAVE